MKSAYDEAVRLLPSKTAAALGERFKAAEEFRLRAGRYPSALIGGREEVIADKAVTCDDIACVLEKATNASLHSVWQDMSKGFISCGFGLRIGVCGTGVISNGKLTGLRDISSVSIRIPKQTTECGGEILKKLCTAKNNVLIISPPGGGKTTFLRECIRVISSSGVRVAVCDERSELAAVFRGVPQFDIGPVSDVMSDIPKSEAALMLLRSMNPQVIAMDEISSPEDCLAAASAVGCGVRVIATAHAASVSDLNRRNVYKGLFTQNVFKSVVVIENNAGVRSYRLETLQ